MILLPRYDIPEDRVGQLWKTPRSLRWSPAIHPHWRWLQARIYEEHWKRNTDFVLPEWEDDAAVISLYSYLRFGTTEEPHVDAAISYITDCVEWDYPYHHSARIKALVLLNDSPEEIANRLGTTPNHITMFEHTFFDVRRYNMYPDYINGIVYDTANPKHNDPSAGTERSWLSTALMLGRTQLERSMSKVMDFSSEGIQENKRAIEGLAVSNALDFLIARTARSAHYEDDYRYFVELNHSTQEQKSNVDIKTINFTAGELLNVIENKTGQSLRSTEKPATKSTRPRRLTLPASTAGDGGEKKPEVVLNVDGVLCPSRIKSSSRKQSDSIEFQT